MSRSSSGGRAPDVGPRAVVVGTGFGCRVHVPALRAAGFEVVGLVGTDAGRTERRSARAGVPAFTSLAGALEAAQPDLVTIATPPGTHAALCAEAISARCHVICEKPFTLDATSAAELEALARRHHVVAVVAHEFRWAEDRATLGRALAEGRIGTPRLATLVAATSLVADPAAPVPAWWWDVGAGGGWLGASGSHVVDQVQSWLGSIETVSASLGLASRREGVAEDSFTIRFRTTGGVDGILQQTAAAWGPLAQTTRIVGDAGTLWLDGGVAWLADTASPAGRRLEVPADLRVPAPALAPSAEPSQRFTHLELGPWTRLAEWVADAMAGRRPWPPPAGVGEPVPATFVDGVAIMAVLDAVRRSAQSGGRVEQVASVGALDAR